MIPSAATYIRDLAEIAILLGALYFGATGLRRLLLPGWSGAIARLAEIVLTIGELVLLLELLGVLSLYRPGFVLVGGIIAGLAIGLLARPREEGWSPPAPDVPLWTIVIATLAATAVAAHWAFPTQAGLDVGMYLPNSTWHNMPFAARFVQTHHIGSLLFTEPLKLSVWFYPQNSELLHSSAMLFFKNDFVSPLVNMGWLAGCLLAAWCIGRPYGVGAASVVGVALICDANMLLLYQPGDAKNDTMGLFFLLAATAMLVNGEVARRRLATGPPKPLVGEGLTQTETFGTGPLVVAALAAGLALGTKINLLAPLAALTIGVIVVSKPAERLRNAGIWAGGLLAGGGFWFIRNLIESGNPLPWINKGPLPGPDQYDIYVREPHNVADYLTNWSVIKNFFIPGLHNDFGGLWPVVLGIILGGIVLVIWRAETPVIRMLGIVAGFAAIAYLFTPLTAAGRSGPTAFDGNVRYLSPALAIGVTLLPLTPVLRRGRWPWIVLGVLALLMLESVLTSNQWAHPGYKKGAIALAFVLIIVPVATTLLWRRNVPKIAIVAGLAIVVAGSLTYGREREKDYLAGRYQPDTVPDQIPQGIPQAMAVAQGLRDQRIALGGTEAGFKQYLFYGRDLSNHVQYIGRHGPDGAFFPITDCADFRRAVNAGDYGYIVIAPSHLVPYGRPAELPWVEPDPNSHLVETFSNVSVFKLTGPLDPAGCAALTPDQRTTDPSLREPS